MRTAHSSSRGGVSTRHPPRAEAPPPRAGTHPPGPGTPLRTRNPPRDQAPPPVDRHTPVNILPCPKLRLRAVMNWNLKQYIANWVLRDTWHKACPTLSKEFWTKIVKRGGGGLLKWFYLSGYLAYTDHHQGRGHPQGRQPSSLIFMSLLYKVS